MARSLHLKQGNVTFAETEPFRLALGGALSPVSLRFAIYGEPNAAGDNVILVCHALSGSARVDEWWPELFAAGGPFANENWCVVCTNILGSCYGSTGPLSGNPATGAPYGAGFPAVTVGDVVRAQARALDLLGIDRLRAVIGGSIGGMQALEWAIGYPDRVDDCIAIGVAPLGALGLALNHIQRQALSVAGDPREGLRLARAIAMCTYKSPELLRERHGRHPNRRGPAPWQSPEGLFDVAGYLDHQGDVFEGRFDADSYAVITRAMDFWDPEREHGPEVFARLKSRVSLVGISSDWLFPAADVHALAHELRDSNVEITYHEIHSSHGHDSFLAEPQPVVQLLKEILGEAPERDITSPFNKAPASQELPNCGAARANPTLQFSNAG